MALESVAVTVLRLENSLCRADWISLGWLLRNEEKRERMAAP